MSLIKLNNAGSNFEDKKLSAPALRQALADPAQNYTTESNDMLKWLEDGSFEGRADLNGAAKTLQQILEPDHVGKAAYGNPNGMKMASFVASFANNLPALLRMQTSVEAKGLADGVRYAPADGSDFESEYSKESFDNQELNDFFAVSIGLNYKIARQGPAMEMVYRTIPLTPEQGGFDIVVPNLFVENTLRHELDGSESDFGFRRVIDSSIDYTVLNDNSTQIVPTYNDTTKDNFVSTTVLAPFEYENGRRKVLTSGLKLGQTIQIFGLGQADSVQRVGQPDYTEALDRNIGIATVFVALGGETVGFDTKGLPFSRYIKMPEQGGRQMSLNFNVSSLEISPTTKAWDGDALTGATFKLIQDGKYTVRLKTRLNGQVDVERGTIDVTATSLTVMYITNEAKERIPLDSGVGQQIVTGLAGLATVAWWPDARLTNSNHRHLGLMLNVRTVAERLLTRQRSPFFVPYPLNENRDQSVMDWLTFAVSQYINNEGVGTLINYHERLMRLTGGLRGDLTVGDFEINALPIEGIGRYLVNPYVQEVEIDLLNNTQSQNTADNVENGIAVLTNALRSVGFDILQRTNYENAARYMDGGEVANKFKFGLVTSPIIERFLTITGDSRTLGANLTYQLESDVDARLTESLYMVMIRDGDGVDPLNAGAMLLTPTLVSTISATRDNRPVNEAIVQPRFQHYNFCPIVVKFVVKGVRELLEQTIPFRVKVEPADVEDGDTDPGTGTGTGGTGAGAGNIDSGAGGA
jgi:hypothetical protein